MITFHYDERQIGEATNGSYSIHCFETAARSEMNNHMYSLNIFGRDESKSFQEFEPFMPRTWKIMLE